MMSDDTSPQYQPNRDDLNSEGARRRIAEVLRDNNWGVAKHANGKEYISLKTTSLSQHTLVVLDVLREQGLEPHLFVTQVSHKPTHDGLPGTKTPLYHIAVERKFEDRMKGELGYKLSLEGKSVQDLGDAPDLLPRAEPQAPAQRPQETTRAADQDTQRQQQQDRQSGVGGDVGTQSQKQQQPQGNAGARPGWVASTSGDRTGRGR